MSLYQKFQTRLLKRWKDKAEDPQVAAFKQAAFSGLSGTVVEIGPGAGTNFKYLPPNIHWIGIEPNAQANDLLRAEAAKRGLTNIGLINGGGEQLSLADNSCDAVIATLVLCSVTNQGQVLAEIKRVLKPGGQYIFVEHVAAPQGSLLRQYQNLSNPLNRLLAGNCNVNRETPDAIRAAGFSNVSVQNGKITLLLTPWPHIWGVATK